LLSLHIRSNAVFTSEYSFIQLLIQDKDLWEKYELGVTTDRLVTNTNKN